MPSTTLTMTPLPKRTKCSRSRAFLSVLALASPTFTQAFHSTASRRASTTRRQRTFRVPGLCQSTQTSRQRARPSSKFFVASTTGRSLNNDNENNLYNPNSGYNPSQDEEEDDEIPWECIIDPNSSDECLDILGEYHQTTRDGIVWTKQVDDEDRVTLADKVSMGATLTACILAFAFLILQSGPGAWRFFLAGGLCAAASHAIPTPLDVVKVRYKIL
jgi:hypothetical protein